MQNKLKKVLSILAVFVVLMGSLFVPVHAEETNLIENPKNATKYPVKVKGLKNEGDKVYAIRLFDALYREGSTKVAHKFKQQEWVVDAISKQIVISDVGFKIESKDMVKIAKKAEELYPNLDTAITDGEEDNEHDSNVHLLGICKDGETEINAELLPGLYLIRIKSANDDVIYNPALLGVNHDGKDVELDMGTDYDGGTDTTFPKSTSGEVKLRQRFMQKIDGEEVYSKAASFQRDEKVTFVIDGIKVPDGQLESDYTTTCIRLLFDDNVFNILSNIKLFAMNDLTDNKEDGNVKQIGIDVSDGAKYGSDTHLGKLAPRTDARFVKLYLTDNNSMHKGLDFLLGTQRLLEVRGKYLRIEIDAEFRGYNPNSLNNTISQIHSYESSASIWEIPKPVESVETPADISQNAQDSTIAYNFSPTIYKYNADEYDEGIKDVEEKIKNYKKAGVGGAQFRAFREKSSSASPMIFDTSDNRNTVITSFDFDSRGIAKMNDFDIKLFKNSEKDAFENYASFKDVETGRGVYYIREIKSPKDFKIDERPIKLTINALLDSDDKSLSDFYVLVQKSESKDPKDFKEPQKWLTKAVIDNDEIPIFEKSALWFPNSKTFVLPTTGSNTMMILTVVGIVLVTGAVVVSRKKKHQNFMS